MGVVTFERALCALSERLSKTAVEHCLRVADTAAELAETYEADVELARLAGLLHDWDRERPRDELVAAARDAGVPVTAVDERVPYLLHAHTGAAGLAESLPGLPQAVLSAVQNHTVGSPLMGDIDMIVYLADMIEPARDYTGVEELRAAVGVIPLTELFSRGYQHSVAHLVERRRWIHPDTVAVWNTFVAGGGR